VGGIPAAWPTLMCGRKSRNLAFAKDVQAHYNSPSGWQDISLPWIANYGDYDLFGRNDGFVTGEFVLRCTQAGVTDWTTTERPTTRSAIFKMSPAATWH